MKRSSVRLLWTMFWFLQGAFPAVYLIVVEYSFLASVFQRIFPLVFLVFAAGVVEITRGGLPRRPETYTRLLLIYYVIAILSTTLSPALTSLGDALRAGGYLAYDVLTLLSILLLVRASSSPRVLGQRMASSYAAGTLIFLLVLVGYADGIHNLLTTGRLSAPTAAATIVGFRSGLAFLMVLTHWQMASSFRFSLATIFAAATVLAFGKTAIGGVLISVTYFVWVYLRAGQVLQGISVMVGILVLTYISYDWVAQKLQDYFRQSGATLTGRSFLWLQIVDMIGDRPIIGHGYSKSLMQSIVADRMQQFGWYQKDNLGQAHNAYLDALFKTGILGLSVFLTLIYKSVNRIRRLASYVENSGVGSYAVKALTIALFLLVHSLTEGHLHMGFDFAILFSLALLAGEIQYLEQKTPRVAAS